MMTFFTILLLLVGANALIMIFSINAIDKKTKKETKNTATSKIYPIDLIPSNYKKAV